MDPLAYSTQIRAFTTKLFVKNITLLIILNINIFNFIL